VQKMMAASASRSRNLVGTIALWAGTTASCIYISKYMPYKDPERKRRWELAHRRERSRRRQAQRSRQLGSSEPSKMETKTPPEPSSKQGSGWGLLILFAGIAFGLPLLFARFGSGQEL
jgi:hypothetical protein